MFILALKKKKTRLNLLCAQRFEWMNTTGASICLSNYLCYFSELLLLLPRLWTRLHYTTPVYVLRYVLYHETSRALWGPHRSLSFRVN